MARTAPKIRATSRRNPALPEPRSIQETPAGGGIGLWSMLGALAVLGVVGLATLTWSANRSDPHFVGATRMLRDYELGKEPGQINYDDPLYQAVLGELALVSPKSVSAQPAASLASDINAKILSFRDRQRKRQAEIEVAVSMAEQRDRALSMAQEATSGTDIGAAERITQGASKECLEEKAGYEKNKAHKH